MKTEPGFFVAGTDTGVGKTQVTAALVAALRAANIEALPVKPVQTGARRGRAPDLDFVLRAAGLTPSRARYAQLAPACLPLAASPHLAARQAGVKLRVRDLGRAVHRVQQEGVFPVVEGAGGLLVPLNDRETMLDLMQALDLPVILVARPGLGTLNHTLLSAYALDGAGLQLAAVVLSQTTRGLTAIQRDNVKTLQHHLHCPVLQLPYLTRPNPARWVAAGRLLLARLDVYP
jgi:dethiobiotin synthase